MTRPREMTTLAELLGDRDTLVLSPHMDDALLSAASIVLKHPTEVWTVFTGRPHPAMTTSWDISCGFPDSDATIDARLAEDAAAFASTPASTRHLDHLEGAYATREEHRSALAHIQSEIAAWMSAHPNGVVIAPACAGLHMPPAPWQPLLDVAARVRSGSASASVTTSAEKPTSLTTSDAREISEMDTAATDSGSTATSAVSSLPKHLSERCASAAKRLVQRGLHAEHLHRRRRAMGEDGLAANPDHLALRDATLAAAAHHPEVRIVLCEDLPYLWHARGDGEVARLEHRTDLTAHKVALPVNVEEKYNHLAKYTSQLPVLDTRGRLLAAENLPDHEVYWILERS